MNFHVVILAFYHKDRLFDRRIYLTNINQKLNTDIFL